MRLERMWRLGLVLCLLSMAGCSRVHNFEYNSDGSSQTIRGAYVAPAFLQAVRARPLLGPRFSFRRVPIR